MFQSPHIKRFAKYAAPAAVLATFFGYYCTPVWDMDFWWHIANGRYIAEAHTVPERDPFGMYETGGLKSDTLLKGYWLAQIILFFTYDFWGANGVICLKAGMLALCLAVTFARSRLVGAGEISTLLVLSVVGMTMLDFTGERPQLFSFIFFPLAVYLLELCREKQARWSLYLLPPLMLLWANSHIGVTLGGAVLCLMGVAYAAEKYLFTSDQHGGKLFFVIIFAAVLCTFLSPNGISAYGYLIARQFGEEEALRDRISEYASPFALWREMGKVLPFYWGFMLLAVVALPKVIKKSRCTPLLVILLLGGLSLSAFRYIPFLVLYAAPYVALGLTRLAAPVRLPVAWLRAGLFAVALTTLGYGIKQGKAFQGGIQTNRFPQGAMEFMQKNRLAGKVFNAFAWGGYLTWYLHPQVKVFIDGRALDMKRFRDYTHILWATPYGIQQLERNRFDFVMIPYANNFTGEQYKLNAYLLQDSRWQAVYRDQAGYLFVRESGELRR